MNNLSFKLRATVSSMLKSHDVWLSPTQDVNHPFVQSCRGSLVVSQ